MLKWSIHHHPGAQNVIYDFLTDKTPLGEVLRAFEVKQSTTSSSTCMETAVSEKCESKDQYQSATTPELEQSISTTSTTSEDLEPENLNPQHLLHPKIRNLLRNPRLLLLWSLMILNLSLSMVYPACPKIQTLSVGKDWIYISRFRPSTYMRTRFHIWRLRSLT